MSKLNIHCIVGKTHFETLCRRMMCILEKKHLNRCGKIL